MKWIEKNWIWVLIALAVIYFVMMRRRPEIEESIEDVDEESGFRRRRGGRGRKRKVTPSCRCYTFVGRTPKKVRAEDGQLIYTLDGYGRFRAKYKHRMGRLPAEIDVTNGLWASAGNCERLEKRHHVYTTSQVRRILQGAETPVPFYAKECRGGVITPPRSRCETQCTVFGKRYGFRPRLREWNYCMKSCQTACRR